MISAWQSRTHMHHSPVFAILHENNTGVCVSHEQIYTQYSSFFLCAFPPLCLLDGVELTGAESFSTSGSKDKLLNAHAEVTYVFSCLPDSFSSPTCSISPSLSMFLVSLVFTVLLFSPSVLVSTMNFCTHTNCFLALWSWISFCQMHKITFQQRDKSNPCWFAWCPYIKRGHRLL